MKRTLISGLLAALALLPTVPSNAGEGQHPSKGGTMTRTVHDFQALTIDGQQRSMADFAGKALLIVNTASRCGFTPQYAALEQLYRRYKDRGFEVLAFPANNFMNQEPGSNEEIQKFCTLRYDTSFPLFAKVSVKGKDIAPLYTYLTTESPFPGAIGWNFTKFLVARDGRVVARFDSKTDPLDRAVTSALEAALAESSRPAAPQGRSRP
jgi:glutathione peroxidase